MGEYRRFVAYVYEYRKGKKEENCGFVKVESWGERCTMELHLQCPGILAGTECKSYAFVREEKKMRGILLGSCKTEANRVSHTLETSPRNIGGQMVALEELGGMVFLTELGAFFGTEWDDIEIVPELFEEFLKEDSQEKEPEEEQKEILKETTDEKSRKEGGKEAGEPEKREAEGILHKENTEEAEVSEKTEPPTEAENVTATEVQQEKPMPGEAYTPFEDGDFFNCRKIKPGDLPCFSRKNCPLRQNRFLLYGYYNFGHLLLCKKDNGQQILGVPGIYDQQERFMANMFGFPFFRKSREIQVPGRQGGYWYRLINSPDFNQRDGFQKDGTKVQ
ncbi:MAG: DUF6128 domain-containing protein [Eubacteriales bacterium]|nr:DUF6128 domain-containing protein [Eubacteriales bacterium]